MELENSHANVQMDTPEKHVKLMPTIAKETLVKMVENVSMELIHSPANANPDTLGKYAKRKSTNVNLTLA